MKLDNISFPHPVLGLSIGDGSFSDEIDVMGLFEVSQALSIADKVSVSIDYSLLSSPQLHRLITDGFAAFACEVNCPKTAFRTIFTSHSSKQDFEIPVDELRDQVIFRYFILALCPFKYSDQGGWHPDYCGQAFDIERGMILGYGGEIRHMIERHEQGSPRGMSLIEVNKLDASSGPYEIDLSGEVLTVFLPNKTFILFDQLYSNNLNFAATFHASLVIPTLVYALATMGSDSGKDYRDKKWYQALETKLSKDERFRDLRLSDLTTAKALEISQRLIDCPFSKLTEALVKSDPQDGED